MSILNWFYKTKQPVNTQEVNPDIFTPTKTYYQYELDIANENAKHRMIYEKRKEEIEEQIREGLTNYWMTPYQKNAEYDVVVSFASFDEMKSFMDTLGRDFDFSYEINIGLNTFIDIYALKQNRQ